MECVCINNYLDMFSKGEFYTFQMKKVISSDKKEKYNVRLHESKNYVSAVYFSETEFKKCFKDVSIMIDDKISQLING